MVGEGNSCMRNVPSKRSFKLWSLHCQRFDGITDADTRQMAALCLSFRSPPPDKRTSPTTWERAHPAAVVEHLLCAPLHRGDIAQRGRSVLRNNLTHRRP